MKALGSWILFCALGASIVSIAPAQELSGPQLHRVDPQTNRSAIIFDSVALRYDTKARDTKMVPLRFDYGAPQRLTSARPAVFFSIEAAERENLRIIKEYQSRNAAGGGSKELHPSRVEQILEQR